MTSPAVDVSVDRSFRTYEQEAQRFVTLWRYEHGWLTPMPLFSLWWRLALKRAVDVVGAAVGLILFAPVTAAVAVAIRLDSRGPVLHRQVRVGRMGRPFSMYKFRSMVVGAEAASGAVWARRQQDPRVTRVGAWLRRLHLDEVPQLLNVLLGHMSLIGPRPERPGIVAQLQMAVPDYHARHVVKPGITGLAQIHYRYDQTVRDVRQKLRFDLLYVRRMCLMLDLRILVWTAFVVVTGRGIR